MQETSYSALKPGYLSQDVADMDTEKNALEYLGVTQKQDVTRARTMLANLGFDAARNWPNLEFSKLKVV